MHPSDEQAPLWSLVRQLEWQTLEHWRKEHHPSLTLEGSMGQAINAVETTVQRRPAGNITVTVSVIARKAFECEVETFALQRAGNRFYKKVEQAEPST